MPSSFEFKFADQNIVNVDKSPLSRMTITSIGLPVFHITCIHAGDFNCHHIECGYNDLNVDGKYLAASDANKDMTLHKDPKNYYTFHSKCCKSKTNPDLAFVRTETTCLLPDRRVNGKFSRSQHSPSLIATSDHITTTSKPVNR